MRTIAAILAMLVIAGCDGGYGYVSEHDRWVFGLMATRDSLQQELNAALSELNKGEYKTISETRTKLPIIHGVIEATEAMQKAIDTTPAPCGIGIDMSDTTLVVKRYVFVPAARRTPTQVMVDDYLASPSGQQFAKAMKTPQAAQDSIPSILTVAAWAAYYNFPTVPPGGEFLEFVFCPPDTGPLPDLYRLRAEYDAAAPNVPPQVAREVPILTVVYVDTLFSDSLRMQAAGVIVLPDSTHAIGPWSQWSTRGEHTGCGN